MRCLGVDAPVTTAVEFSVGGLSPVLSAFVGGPFQLTSSVSGSEVEFLSSLTAICAFSVDGICARV